MKLRQLPCGCWGAQPASGRLLAVEAVSLDCALHSFGQELSPVAVAQLVLARALREAGL